MSINDELLRTTVRIVSKLGNGSVSCGTGVLVSYPNTDGTDFLILYTNWHVIEGAVETILKLTIADENGRPTRNCIEIDIKDSEMRWMKHPEWPDVDLAATPFGYFFNGVVMSGNTPYVKAFGYDQLQKRDDDDYIDAIAEIIMIGYPSGLYDEANNLPFVRRGITATPFNADYQGRKEFAIDCACFGGSSGSPVVLYENGMIRANENSVSFGRRFKLLGLLYSGPQYGIDGNIVFDAQLPMVQSMMPMNIGYVIKAERLIELAKPLADLHGASLTI